jgi:hypothetical protein
MSPAVFESKTPANELPLTHALYRAITGIGIGLVHNINNPGKSSEIKS